MGRIDERLVGQRQDLVVQGVVQPRRQVVGGDPHRAQEVGPADVADEERVAGEDRLGNAVALREVQRQDRDPLGRVPRGLHDREARIAELDHVAVLERRELVLRARPCAEEDPRSDPIAELQVTRDEVGVEVREQDVLDRGALRLGVLDVLVDVALRVDDGSGACPLVDDEVGVLDLHGRMDTTGDPDHSIFG